MNNNILITVFHYYILIQLKYYIRKTESNLAMELRLPENLWRTCIEIHIVAKGMLNINPFD